MSSSRKALNSETSRRPFSVTSLTAGDSASTALPISSETGLGLRLHAAFVFSITQISFPIKLFTALPQNTSFGGIPSIALLSGVMQRYLDTVAGHLIVYHVCYL